jgi:hypothetical protein
MGNIGTLIQFLNHFMSDSIHFLNKKSQKSSAHSKYYSLLTLYDYNEYIQHTTKHLRADQKKTRSSRTGSLTSSSSNVFLWKHCIRTSTTDTNKRDIPNWIHCDVLGNCCKVGIEVEKIGQ